MNDINVNGNRNVLDSNGDLVADHDTLKTWTPIGTEKIV